MPLGLSDTRLRLAYLHQHREWALAALFGLGLGARLAGWPLAGAALAALGAWCLLALVLLWAARRVPAVPLLLRLIFAYCVLEVCLVMALALLVRAPAWLVVLFGLLPVGYAAMLLGRNQARCIAALAAANFGLYLRWQSAAAGASRSWHVAAMLALAALIGYGLVAGNLGLFAGMLRSQAAALQSANSELLLHRTHLADLVGERTRDLQQVRDQLLEANADLVRLNRVKDCFLANVSHELRTPLTSIRSCAEVLLDVPAEAPERVEFAAMIRDEAGRLTRLINDLLDLSAIQAGGARFHPQPVALAAVARASVGLMRELAAQKGLRLSCRIPARLPPVLAEPDRLHQVLTNLLSNAVKFTSRGSIEVLARADAGEVILCVRDTGVGIAAGDVEAVFDKFYQAGNLLTDKPAGTGLGLAICREIMRRHGGRIWVESRLGEGSTFCCAFPAAAGRRQQRPPATISVRSAA